MFGCTNLVHSFYGVFSNFQDKVCVKENIWKIVRKSEKFDLKSINIWHSMIKSKIPKVNNSLNGSVNLKNVEKKKNISPKVSEKYFNIIKTKQYPIPWMYRNLWGTTRKM